VQRLRSLGCNEPLKMTFANLAEGDICQSHSECTFVRFRMGREVVIERGGFNICWLLYSACLRQSPTTPDPNN
jgi:hypothetical protein